jgi:TolB-like protein/Tfp pilus assembly protein PilF
MKLPDWTLAMVLFIGIVGFPFTLVVAWAFELTADGLKRTDDVHPEESIAGDTGTTLNRIIIGLLGLAVILLLADRLLVDQAAEGDPVEASTEPKSIAVLPFVNMSNDPEQEYFSDGISEDLLVGLAHFDKLRVAARTSAFSFKGQNTDIKEIGEKLDVDTILEGSVRKSGNRLRITAQLINVADGYHLWSGTFDRELTDIFAIQDEISAAIISALRVHLADDETVADSTALDFEAYNFYLKAKANLATRKEAKLLLALEQYQKAIDIEPTYAAAWAGMAATYNFLSEVQYGGIPYVEALDKMRQAVEMALSLDPDQWQAHAMKSFLEENPRDSIVSMERAIAANPSEGILYSWRSDYLYQLGQYNEARASMRQAYKVDPLGFVTRNNMAGILADEGKTEKAYALVAPGTLEFHSLEAGIAYSEGRWADTIRAYQKGIAVADGQQHRRLERRLGNDYSALLSNREKAREHLRDSPAWLLLINMFADPVGTYPTINDTPTEIRELSLPISLLLQGRCQELLELEYLQSFVAGPIRGNPAGGSVWEFGRYNAYSWCLRQVGRIEESRELALRMQVYIEDAIIAGFRGGYHFNLAFTQMMLDDNDAAMNSLQLAWEEFRIRGYFFEYPWVSLLEDREDFQVLKQAVYAHINAERAKLGMEPVSP